MVLKIKKFFNAKHLIGFGLAAAFFLEFRKGYFKDLPAYLKSRSFKPSARTLVLILCSVPFVILFMHFADPVLLRHIQALHAPVAQGVVILGRFIGKNNNFWKILLTIYFLAIALRQEVWSKTAFGAILASVLTGLASTGLKWTFLRYRPDGNPNSLSFFNWDGLVKDNNLFQSFPSGDVALVTGACTYFFYAFKNHAFRWGIFLLPLATAFSRVSVNRHWPSDTLFSIFLGLVVARFVWDYRKTTI